MKNSPNIIGDMRTGERSAQVPISESDVVEVIKRRVVQHGALREDEIGVGDDAAVLRFDDPHIVLTADAMVEGVHFLSQNMSWHDVGWKCIVSNQSDIAAMGALPEHALLTLATPPTTSIGDIEEILSGVIGALDRYGGRLVGGDTVSSDIAMLSVSLTGRLVDSRKPLTRGLARVGQLIAVTGALGGSAGGLAVLSGSNTAEIESGEAEHQSALVDAHVRPDPRVDLVSEMVGSGIECAMDISDGLLIDLERICQSSDVDAVIYADAVPVNENLLMVFPDRALEMALTGGEDYEILYVDTAESIAQVNAAQPERTNSDFGIIGEIVPRRGTDAKVTVLDGDGSEIEFSTKGWDHFAMSSGGGQQ